MITSRRDFLRQLGALSAVSFASSPFHLGLMQALAADTVASDYKALVCVFLFGGNDGNNTIVPLDTAEYNAYATIRGALALGQSSLIPIALTSSSSRYGLHPSLVDLQSIWSEKKLAVLANVGPLVEPLTKTQYLARSKSIPQSLFSHSDQQTQWQTAVSDKLSRTGWGGRLANATEGLNGSSTFPAIISTAGTNLLVTGEGTIPLAIPTSGGFGLNGFTSSAAASARLSALKQLLGLDGSNTLVKATSETTADAINNSAILSPILTSTTSQVTPIFANLNTNISNQLQQVAKTIEARNTLGLKRQIFFCSLGGFDTHANQLVTQANLLGQLGAALKAFYDATVKLGVASNVTTFTLSDFGRTYKPASGGGTDHAWGNHQLIMGGAVKGGDFYGQWPTLVLAGPDDISSEGRWVPTTSVDQYIATLALWYGLNPSSLSQVLPNIGRFSNVNLSFLT